LLYYWGIQKWDFEGKKGENPLPKVDIYSTLGCRVFSKVGVLKRQVLMPIKKGYFFFSSLLTA